MLVKLCHFYFNFHAKYHARLSIYSHFSAQLEVTWFNPRTGGELLKRTVSSIQGEGLQLLGTPLQEDVAAGIGQPGIEPGLSVADLNEIAGINFSFPLLDFTDHTG